MKMELTKEQQKKVDELEREKENIREMIIDNIEYDGSDSGEVQSFMADINYLNGKISEITSEPVKQENIEALV